MKVKDDIRSHLVLNIHNGLMIDKVVGKPLCIAILGEDHQALVKLICQRSPTRDHWQFSWNDFDNNNNNNNKNNNKNNNNESKYGKLKLKKN